VDALEQLILENMILRRALKDNGAGNVGEILARWKARPGPTEGRSGASLRSTRRDPQTWQIRLSHDHDHGRGHDQGRGHSHPHIRNHDHGAYDGPA